MLLPLLAHTQTAEAPNIIVILTDDMGYSDISPYGSEIRTPNLEFLADNGLRYSDFYVTPRCSPSRAALLTGQYSHAVGMGHLTGDAQNGNPGFANDLARGNNRTIPEMLRTAGYTTQAIGKWHIARNRDKDLPLREKYNWPLQRGFDDYYGTIEGGGSFYDPGLLTRGNTVISPFSDAERAIYDKQLYTVAAYDQATAEVARNASAKPSEPYYHYTDAISDQTVRYINDHFRDPASSGKPLFQYVAYTAAHWPLHGLPEDQRSYDGVYANGYAPIRAARAQRAKAAGLISGETPLPPMDLDNWNAMSPGMRAFQELEMETYAGMITQMDRGIGRIIEALRANGQLDNTLILYMHDNGGNHEGGHSPNTVGPNLPSRPGGPVNGLRDKDFIVTGVRPTQTRDGYNLRGPDGGRPTRNTGAPDTYEYGSKQWGNVSNTPFREYKSDAAEGGIASPLIAYWGRGIDASLRGSIVRDPSHLVDIMATIKGVANADYPSNVLPLAGISLQPNFTGATTQRGEPLFWEHEGWHAVRDGRWKILSKDGNAPWELYDMTDDRSETRDVAAANPDVVARLAGTWEDWANRNSVLPWPWNPRYATSPIPGKWYLLKNRDSGLYMRAEDCGTGLETRVELFDETGDCAQWQFVNKDGIWRIKNRRNGLNLRHDGETVVSDVTVAEFIDTDLEKTFFDLLPAPAPGYYNIQHVGSKLNLRNNDCERVSDQTLVEFFAGDAECAQWQFIEVDGTGNGLTGAYYNGRNFENFVFDRTDANVDFDWGLGSPGAGVNADGFSVRWTGQIEPDASGSYTFYLDSDNGRRLWVDGQLLVDAWVDDWNTEYTGSINLEAGRAYDFRLEYFENVGGASCGLEWSGPSTARASVPERVLSPTGSSGALVGRSSGDDAAFSLHPNPARSELFVTSASAIERVSIYSIHGREVLSTADPTVDVADLASGIYLLEVADEQGTSSRTFVKE